MNIRRSFLRCHFPYKLHREIQSQTENAPATDPLSRVLITAELIYVRGCYVLLRYIQFRFIKYSRYYVRTRSEQSDIRAVLGISKDNISKTLKSTHRECDSKVTCLSLIRTECSVIFAALKRMRTLAKVQEEEKESSQMYLVFVKLTR